jgi:RHS repeat-associated protein
LIVCQGYQYNAIGNIQSVTGANGAKRNHSWTSFDNPLSMSVAHPALSNPAGTPGSLAAGSASIAWLYGPENQRIRESFSKTTGSQTDAKTLYVLHPDNEGSLYFEREVKTAGAGAGTAENRHYLSAEKGSFLLITSNGQIQTEAQQTASITAPAAIANAEQRYWHKDHLGSIVASTNSNLTVIERMAYDPFGKRRFINGAYDQVGTIDAQSTNRGFTGHEHLDELDFIHMNARVYDPDIGRFLSPDPTVPYINNPQAFNRYAYAVNNPLNYIDKDGFTFSPVGNQTSIADTAPKSGDASLNEGNALGKAEALSATGSTPGTQPSSPSSPGFGPHGVREGDEVVAENSRTKSKLSTPAPARPSQSEIEVFQVEPGNRRGLMNFPSFFTRPGSPAKVSPAPAAAPAPSTQKTQQQPATTNQVKAEETERLRHFTNSRGISGIEQDNTIKASDQNKVFTEKAAGKPAGPRDAEEKLGISRGRGNNFVEFDAKKSEFNVVNNPKTGATERVFQGDVDLTGRNPTFHENRGRR